MRCSNVCAETVSLWSHCRAFMPLPVLEEGLQFVEACRACVLLVMLFHVSQ